MRALRSVPALVLLGVLLAQAAWILAVPPFRGIDEFDHAYRAAAVARGEWVADNGDAEHGRGGLVTVPRDIVDAAHRQCSALKYTGHDNCNPVQALPDGSVRVASAASRYNPILYWYLGTVAKPFHGAAADYAMRIAGSVLCAVGLAACAAVLHARTRGLWPRLGLLLGLTPVLVYSTVLPAGNGLEMVAGLLLWCSLLALPVGRLPGDGRLVALAAISASVLVTVRSLGPIFAVLIVGCVALARGRDLNQVVRSHTKGLATATGFSVLATAGSAAWVLLQDPLGGDRKTFAKLPWTELINVLPLNLFQVIDVAPARNEQGPVVVYLIYLVALLALVVMTLRATSGRGRAGFVTALASTQALPLAISAPALHSLGPIWQGRYALAFTAGVAVFGGYLLERSGRPAPRRRVVVTWVVAIGSAQVVATAFVIRRELGLTVSAGDPGWARTSVLLVAIVAAAGWVVVGLAALRPSAVIDPVAGDPGPVATEHTDLVSTGEGRERAADGWPWRPST